MSFYPAFPIVRTLLPLHELVYLEGVKNYTFLYFEDGSRYCHAKTLRLFEEGLPADTFVRINKSYLIRRDFIAHYNNHEALLMNGLSLRISRRRKIR